MARPTVIRRYGLPSPDVPDSALRKRSSIRAVRILAPVAMLSGCTTQAPTVTVEGVSVRSRTADAVVVDVALSLSNDNTGEVVLQEFQYTVAAGSSFTGRRRADLTLAPLSTESLVIPAVLVGSPEAGPPDVASLRVNGTVGWRGSADLEKAFFDSGLYRPNAAFSATVSPGGPPATTASPPAPVEPRTPES